MAVVNSKSTTILGADATPPTRSGSFINGGRLKESVAFITPAASDDDGSVYRLHRVPSNMRVSELSVKHEVVTGMVDVNIGIYDIDANGGGAVDDNVFADAVDFDAGARALFTEIDTLTAVQSELRLWELLGLSEDPVKNYDLCLTAITVGAGIEEIACRLKYAQ